MFVKGIVVYKLKNMFLGDINRTIFYIYMYTQLYLIQLHKTNYEKNQIDNHQFKSFRSQDFP